MDIVLVSIVFSILKYLFFLGAVSVILNVQTIYSVFCLIFVFLVAASLAILGGAVFVGFVSIVVYVGSVLIFSLFVTMMLDIRVESKFNFTLFSLITFIVWLSVSVEIATIYANNVPIDFEFLPIIYSQPNIVTIGCVLYTWYSVGLILCAIILFIAMLGTIVLLGDIALSGSHNATRLQNIGFQIGVQDFASMELQTSSVYYYI